MYHAQQHVPFENAATRNPAASLKSSEFLIKAFHTSSTISRPYRPSTSRAGQSSSAGARQVCVICRNAHRCMLDSHRRRLKNAHKWHDDNVGEAYARRAHKTMRGARHLPRKQFVNANARSILSGNSVRRNPSRSFTARASSPLMLSESRAFGNATQTTPET